MAPCCKTEHNLPLDILFRTAIFLLLLGASGCGQRSGERNTFLFSPDENGVSLSKRGGRCSFTGRTPKTLTGEYICNHYIHPLFSLNGDTLTQEFPEDHPYHRGSSGPGTNFTWTPSVWGMNGSWKTSAMR